ncbi:cyclin PCL2 Ecym_8038 [Eremothecium cymbalariae DBVPG|uniref:Cyclin-like domain-containing protein n=1 Tax=Eremothecium cymbalariae (strain CBS 270.75 / DBVPG 7215 / KCTC 17166 / NRRL Y-17582) TaxID=931890 RepID=G8JWW0_ERECY|nr:Hypothetical protein Ecym_8038 [Eremothecium cymbalariae DBVPG\
MSDYEALLRFNKLPVSIEMVHFLASTTASIIQVKSCSSSEPILSLVDFIKGLINKSNVQTPTLMSTVVYLTRLRSIIPPNVHGIETTRHRIFLGCLILASKNLNDSSPMNKHWCQYTNSLLSLREVNTVERELLEYFNWDLLITNKDLITCLSYFLKPIKELVIADKKQAQILYDIPLSNNSKEFILKNNSIYSSTSNLSIPSLGSSNTISTLSTTSSRNTQRTAVSTSYCYFKTQCIEEERKQKVLPLREANVNSEYGSKKRITRPIILYSKLERNKDIEVEKYVQRKKLATNVTSGLKRSNWVSFSSDPSRI